MNAKTAFRFKNFMAILNASINI